MLCEVIFVVVDKLTDIAMLRIRLFSLCFHYFLHVVFTKTTEAPFGVMMMPTINTKALHTFDGRGIICVSVKQIRTWQRSN